MLADLIKVHCLTHGVTFPMSRTSRGVVCKEGSEEHTLSTNFPNEGLWVYCCNCQTFIAWDLSMSDVNVQECLFCFSSLNPRAYACDHCAITMVDYDDQTLRKQHMVLSWGMPQPACPGCHRFPGATPRMHFCEKLKIDISTARAECPFCGIDTAQPAQHLSAEPALAIPVRQKEESRLAIAEAEAKAREAEERIHLAEATARKEIALRVEAERRADEFEKKVTADLHPMPALLEPDWSQREAELARAKAEEAAKARFEAEERAREIEKRLRMAEDAARAEAEKRAAAESKAQEMADTLQAVPEALPPPKKSMITIALYASLAGVLFILLIILVGTMIRLAGI